MKKEMKVLTLLIESCCDYAFISPEFGNSIHTSEIFISVLVSTIAIDTATLNHDENKKKKKKNKKIKM